MRAVCQPHVDISSRPCGGAATCRCHACGMRIVLALIALAACRKPDREPVHVDPTPELSPARAPASSAAFYADTFTKRPSVRELTELGARVFADPSLSASGTVACASCHDPAHAFGPANADAVQLGGTRAAPSLRYLQIVPRFTEHFYDEDDPADQGPAGGYTWDGRMATTHDQAHAPLFSPLEMANASPADFADRLRNAAYAGDFRAAFGDTALDTPASALKAATLALEVYQQDPATFYPYASKYDAVLRGTATLSPREARGRALFEDPAKGNCASCHPDTVSSGFPALTDFGFVALGAPRNRAIPANADPAYFDLGLCGPYRTDLATHAEYCGMFRTPSLRNVAVRRRFFHNGVFTSLPQVVEFYATRDSDPKRWYRGEPFDDLPPRYRSNVHRDPPFGGKRRLSPDEVRDIVAFLETLTDGVR